jgi:hypothetical protein
MWERIADNLALGLSKTIPEESTYIDRKKFK